MNLNPFAAPADPTHCCFSRSRFQIGGGEERNLKTVARFWTFQTFLFFRFLLVFLFCFRKKKKKIQKTLEFEEFSHPNLENLRKPEPA